MNWRFRLTMMIFTIGVSPALLSTTSASHDHSQATSASHDHSQTTSASHDHSHAIAPVKRTVVAPRIPAVTLVRDDGTKVDFSEELRDPRPIYLNFIFTSCTTVCPVMSQIFSALQDRLGADRAKVRMISISIDPEYDTPPRLTAYARQFGADDQWHFYTGTTDTSLAVQRAFDLVIRDKMNHPVASFYRGAPGQPWVRIDGFASPEQLEAEYRSMAGG